MHDLERTPREVKLEPLRSYTVTRPYYGAARSFLYWMLAARAPEINISHRHMPTWEQHCEFINSDPYLEWWLVAPMDSPVEHPEMPWIGQAYVTEQHEVGIFLLDDWQCKGYGDAIMDEIEARYPTLVANISPLNESSQAFFKRRGYKLVQHTYRKAPDPA